MNIETKKWEVLCSEEQIASKLKELGEQISKDYEGKNLLKDSEGAKIIEVSREDDNAPMPPLLFVKSNNLKRGKHESKNMRPLRQFFRFEAAGNKRIQAKKN